MKKSKLFGLALVAITASFSACSDLTEEMLKESEIKLTNEITPVSRVADLDYQSTQIVAEQEVGVTITGAKSEHNNIKWTTGTDGVLTNGGNPVYYSGNNAVTIIAYHPYNSDWTETSHIFSVNTNQSTNEGYLESDLLWASETSTKTEEAVALTFTHKLSKINVTLTSEDNANLSNATISICGTNISTSFNPSTGELSATTANVQDIKAGTTTSTASAIVIPQTVASGTKFIKVELSGKIFYYTLKADKELKSGYSHNYTLTVKEKEVEVGTESDKITDWEDDNNSGDAEEDSNNISTIKTVNNATAGKLATLLTQKEKETLTSLKITGNLNSDDIRFIREMAGGPINTSSTPSNGSLISLDISGCEIVEGGDYFFESNSTKYYTADKDLGEYAFAYTKLESIELPTTITSLKHRVLAYTKIKEITIPNSVTNFNGSELFSTETLTTVHLPAYLNYHLVNGVFHNCPNLKTITIDDSNQYFTVADDGLLYVQWGNEYALYCCPAANTTATIDPNTEFIMYASFSYSKIESLVIPQNVKRIDTHVFKDCNLLQSIKVESATPPEAHRMVTNGTTGEEFAQTAFDMFSNINNCTLYVPEGSINAYKEALGWKSFTNIVEYEKEENI